MYAQDTLTLWFLFYNNQLLLQKKDATFTVPVGLLPPFPVVDTLEVPVSEASFGCRAATLLSAVEESAEYVLMDLRATWGVLDAPLYKWAGKASQLVYWHTHSRFCPVCGSLTDQLLPTMKKCPACGYELYPVISTAILALVRKEDAILLVHALNFRGPFHSLVAGFLEPGESLEECVAREVKEETGLSIKDITFFGNQPWPYPSGLMVGYIADYAGGEIRLQEDELSSGAFYTRENLPELPRKASLARAMIDWWLAGEPALNHAVSNRAEVPLF